MKFYHKWKWSIIDDGYFTRSFFLLCVLDKFYEYHLIYKFTYHTPNIAKHQFHATGSLCEYE